MNEKYENLIYRPSKIMSNGYRIRHKMSIYTITIDSVKWSLTYFLLIKKERDKK